MSMTPRTNASLPTGIVTFLFTDIEGSTTLWERHPEAMQIALAHHDTLLRTAIEKSDGFVVKSTGDGVHAVFVAAADALTACLAAQRALQVPVAHTSNPEPAASRARLPMPLKVRMGLHTGAAELRDGDYFGASLNRAARIMAVAHGDQILLSAATAELVRGHLPEGVTLREMGEHRLKGLLAPERLLQVVAAGLRADFPPLASQTGHSLPAERDAFVGRSNELASLARRFEGGARLITLHGAGGSGKTRLARRYALNSLADWLGGVYFCDLSEARGRDGIYFAVASALGVQLTNEDPAVLLGHAIAGRGHCLIILDNFEQVQSHAPMTLGRWLDRAPEASFLVTSRERLQLAGESLFAVEPLPLTTDAVELFNIRAKAQRPELALDANSIDRVAEIVRLLDGMPLAIELAAARVRVLSLAQIAERMSDRFRVLAGGGSAAARQATMKAAIDWSWDLLAPWEQAALATFSVFEGGFSLRAAEAVLDLSDRPGTPPALDIVQSLVDKSLLRTWLTTGGDRADLDEPYFGMYLSIHEYAAAKLDACGVSMRRVAEERHGTYFAQLGSEDALEALGGREGIRRRRELALALDNLVAAFRRAALRGDTAILVPTYRAAWEVIEARGPISVGLELGKQLPSLGSTDDELLTAAHVSHARALWRAGQLDVAAELLRAIVSLASQRADHRQEGIARMILGNILRTQGRFADAHEQLQAALRRHREVGNRRAEAQVQSNIGSLYHDQDRFPEAEAHYLAAVEIYRELGDSADKVVVLGNLANLAVDTNRFDEARRRYDEALETARRAGDRRREGVVFGNMANLADATGCYEEALKLSKAALAIHREVGNRRFEGNVLANLGQLHFARGDNDNAIRYLKAALEITTEVGDRRMQGAALCHLGAAYCRPGRFDEARECLQQSVNILHSIGSQRLEGMALGRLGEVLAQQHSLDEARAAFDAGAALLRKTDDRAELGKLLSVRARAEFESGHRDVALSLLRAVKDLATALGPGADSALRIEIANLQSAGLG